MSPIELEEPKLNKTKSFSHTLQKRDFTNNNFLTEETLFT